MHAVLHVCRYWGGCRVGGSPTLRARAGAMPGSRARAKHTHHTRRTRRPGTPHAAPRSGGGRVPGVGWARPPLTEPAREPLITHRIPMPCALRHRARRRRKVRSRRGAPPPRPEARNPREQRSPPHSLAPAANAGAGALVRAPMPRASGGRVGRVALARPLLCGQHALQPLAPTADILRAVAREKPGSKLGGHVGDDTHPRLVGVGAVGYQPRVHR
mmetsp:Transcript_19015/g.51535  ORF Transcript_19015/g.51535 Transcript_19015/m.51535 type:complete len:216 (-) Transcript_19015:2002-2649(-)